MPADLDNALAQMATLSTKLHAKGRGIFDAARNTDLVQVVDAILVLSRYIAMQPPQPSGQGE